MKAASDASYFDLFGSVLLVWPAAVNAPILGTLRYGEHAVRILGYAVAWTPTAVAVRWPMLDVEGAAQVDEVCRGLLANALGEAYEVQLLGDDGQAALPAKRK